INHDATKDEVKARLLNLKNVFQGGRRTQLASIINEFLEKYASPKALQKEIPLTSSQIIVRCDDIFLAALYKNGRIQEALRETILGTYIPQTILIIPGIYDKSNSVQI